MPKENLSKKRVEISQKTERREMKAKDRSTLTEFRENVIKRIPLVMSFDKIGK